MRLITTTHEPNTPRHGAAAPGVSVLLVVALLWSAWLPAAGSQDIEISLPSHLDLRVKVFPATGERLLIWLPSKYGIRPGNASFARSVQQNGVDYWLVDLHASYLAPTGRQGYAEFRPQHIKELIDHAVDEGWRHIVVGGASRGAALAMKAARLWQRDHPGDDRVAGLVLFHPYLIDGYTPIGDEARLEPIARMTNLPVYLVQPELNTKHLLSERLMAQLEQGGAAVYFHPLDGVRGGFHLRAPDLLRPPEVDARARIGADLRRAIDLLVRLPKPDQAAAVAAADAGPDSPATASTGDLRVLEPGAAMPLRLRDEHGRDVDLSSYRPRVVLVNFWATWCGPCVREIASLVRLVEHFDGTRFRVLTVNVGENRQHVSRFFSDLDVTPNFDVLFDPDGDAAKIWRVHAVPSTYLVDGHGLVRYGYRGALRWDRPDVIETIQALLDETADLAGDP